MKNLYIIFFIFIMSTSILFSQVDKSKINDAFKNLDDAVTEVEEGKLSIYFFNCQNGESIVGADVEVEKIGSFKTDLAGRVLFDAPDVGGFYVCLFKKNGFITSKFTLEIEGESIFSNNRFSVSPIMDLNYVRIVLDWGKRPKDLDGHLVKSNQYHISYQNMHVSKDGYAILDRDDRSSYGPETITIKKVDDESTYYFYVHNYSDMGKSRSSKLSNSKANIKIYGNSQLLHVIPIPKNNKGNFWDVFKIVQGKIIIVNKVVRSI